MFDHPGRDLLSMSKSGKTEPRITAVLANAVTGREIDKEKFESTSKASSSNPVWNEKFNFGKVFNLGIEPSMMPTLVVTIMHNKLPMGTVELKLSSCQSDTDDWFTLTKLSSMPMVSGELHLKLKWNNPPKPSIPLSVPSAGGAQAAASAASQGRGGGGQVSGELIADGEPDNPEYAGQDPNEVRIVCVQGRNLIACDTSFFGPATSDPRVKIKIVGCDTKKTKYIPKTLNPVWNETLVFADVHDISKSIEVIVEDYDMSGTDFMGKVLIQLRDLSDKKPIRRWYKLGNKSGEMDEVKRGEVELQVWWHFNPALLANKKRHSMFESIRNMGSILVPPQEDSEDEDDSEATPTLETKKTQAQIDAEEEEKKKIEEDEKKARGDIEMKDGDYQIQVHIIEARDLKPENLDGTSDPIVYVECLDQKQNTKVIYQKLNCVFDDVLIFNFKNIARETVEDGIIRISVMDANSVPMLKNTMIGAYTFDATAVYFSKDHEIYRKWVALMDDEDPEDLGVQGYLKLSVQMIGELGSTIIHSISHI